MRYLVFIFLLALSIFNVTYAADVPGSVVFVKLAGKDYDSRSDVYEKKLTGGNVKKLIDHTTLPDEFQGRIDSVLPASDGSLFLLKESNTNIIRNTTTGITRKVFGSEYSTITNEVLDNEIKGSCWIWSRTDSSIRKIKFASPVIIEPLGWSPLGKQVLLYVSDAETFKGSIQIYDTSTDKLKIIRPISELVFANWTPDASAILVGDQSDSAATMLSLISLDGKVRNISTRSRRIFTAAVSPDGNKVAVGDTSGFYIIDLKKQTQRKLSIPVSGSWPDGNIAFSADGKKLAILISSTSSGLYADVNESLWTIDMSTAKARLVKKWSTTLGNSPGEDETHWLHGWVPKQSALFVIGRSCTIQGDEMNWRRLWLVSTNHSQAAKKISDTGSYGIDMSWWGK